MNLSVYHHSSWKILELTLRVATIVYDQMWNENSERSFWLTEKSYIRNFANNRQDIIVSFSQKRNKSISASGRYLPVGKKKPVERKFVIKNVKNLKLEKQTCERTIL